LLQEATTYFTFIARLHFKIERFFWALIIDVCTVSSWQDGVKNPKEGSGGSFFSHVRY
jgi:hypothetical protein